MNQKEGTFTQNEFTVRGTEIDFSYRLKPYHIASYFQENFARFCATHGLAAYQLEKNQITWVLADMQIELLQAPPLWYHKVTVVSWHRQVKGLKLIHDYQAFCNGQEIARGTSTWLTIHTKTRRPQPLELLNAEMVLPEKPPFDSLPPLKLTPLTQWIASDQQMVKSYDIDFNHHLNSVRYVAGAIETIPFELRQNHRCTSIKVKYLHEVHLGETLRCETFRQDHCFFHVITKQELKVCEINTVWEKQPE